MSFGPYGERDAAVYNIYLLNYCAITLPSLLVKIDRIGKSGLLGVRLPNNIIFLFEALIKNAETDLIGCF